MNGKEYYFKYVVPKLLHIDDDVTSNLKILDDSPYMIFLEQLEKTTEMLIVLELKYTQKTIQWPHDWLSEEDVKETRPYTTSFQQDF